MGSSFVPLSFQFMRVMRTISGIIADTTSAIWTMLQPLFMPSPNDSKWKLTAERYLDLWNLPNCIGSIDGKHIHIKCFPKMGSLYFKNKGCFSVILLASGDTDTLFTTVHVGDFGKNSNGYVFRASTLWEMLEKEELCIPFPTSLPLDDSGKTFP